MTGKRQGGVLAANGAAGRKLGKQRQQLFVFTVRISISASKYSWKEVDTVDSAELSLYAECVLS